jgi:hypothetical protein
VGDDFSGGAQTAGLEDLVAADAEDWALIDDLAV